jgi:hypothetical protein
VDPERLGDAAGTSTLVPAVGIVSRHDGSLGYRTRPTDAMGREIHRDGPAGNWLIKPAFHRFYGIDQGRFEGTTEQNGRVG